MAKIKLYFLDEDSETCHSANYLLEQNDAKELEVFEAIRIKDELYFYCKEYESVGEKGECGKHCEGYEPRNGKSGCCRHIGKLYEHGEKITIKA